MNNRTKSRWIWIAYLIGYTFYMTQLTQEFFLPDSALRNYYIILTVFHAYYLIPFYMNALMIAMNICAIVPVYCYIFKRKIFSEKFWKIFCVLRVVAEINGHHYEEKVVRAFWSDDPWVSISIIAMGICWLVPSYIALYFYAFKRPQTLS